MKVDLHNGFLCRKNERKGNEKELERKESRIKKKK